MIREFALMFGYLFVIIILLGTATPNPQENITYTTGYISEAHFPQNNQELGWMILKESNGTSNITIHQRENQSQKL